MVDRAVIPAAGYGTRMLPLTKAMPKEMLPFGTKPMIHWAVEELIQSGVHRICIVIRKGKEIIREYFQSKYFSAYNPAIKKMMNRCELSFVYQQKPRGLGDAILTAEKFVDKNPFIMSIPDQHIILSKAHPVSRLLKHFKACDSAIWTSLVKVPKRETRYFEGSRGFKLKTMNKETFIIENLLSDREVAGIYKNKTFEIRGIGRTLLQPQIFSFLSMENKYFGTKDNDFTKAFMECANKMAHYGVMVNGTAIDLGTLTGYTYYMAKHNKNLP